MNRVTRRELRASHVPLARAAEAQLFEARATCAGTCTAAPLIVLVALALELRHLELHVFLTSAAHRFSLLPFENLSNEKRRDFENSAMEEQERQIIATR